MSASDRVIFVAANPQQAYLLRNLLEEHGISAYVTNDTLNSVHFGLGDVFVRGSGGPGFFPNAPRVVVSEEDAEEARRIVLEAEARQLEGGEAPELERLAETVDEAQWPACPSCNRPRLATCPVCQSSGTHLPEAFLPEELAADAETEDGRTKLTVICPTCDEVFEPKFPARCEWCGYRFADGVEPPPLKPNVTPPVFLTDFNARAVLLLAGMASVVAALLGWFS